MKRLRPEAARTPQRSAHPDVPQQGSVDEVRRIHEEYLATPLSGFFQGRFQFLVEELLLVLDMLLEGLLRRDGDGRHLAWLEVQRVEELADLGQTACDASPLADHLSGNGTSLGAVP